MPSDPPDWLTQNESDVLLQVLVTPRASRTTIQGTHGDRLKISLRSPPVEGAANKELIRLLSKILSLPRSRIQIQGGQGSRRKTIRLEDFHLSLAISRLCNEKDS
jgi:hypothetical protein